MGDRPNLCFRLEDQSSIFGSPSALEPAASAPSLPSDQESYKSSNDTSGKYQEDHGHPEPMDSPSMELRSHTIDRKSIVVCSPSKAEGATFANKKGTRATTRCVDGPPIDVVVGAERESFMIHKGALTTHSKYFDTMFSGDWEETNTGIVNIPDVDADAFVSFYNFLYGKGLTSEVSLKTEKQYDAEYKRLVDLYALGQRLQSPSLKNAVIDAVIAMSKTAIKGKGPNATVYFPGPEVAKAAYEKTLPGSPLRRLLVDQHCFHGDRSWLEAVSLADCSKEFLRDLNLAMFDWQAVDGVKEAPYEKEGGRSYHEPTADGDSPRTRKGRK